MEALFTCRFSPSASETACSRVRTSSDWTDCPRVADEQQARPASSQRTVRIDLRANIVLLTGAASILRFGSAMDRSVMLVVIRSVSCRRLDHEDGPAAAMKCRL